MDVSQLFSVQLDGLPDISRLDAGVVTADLCAVKISILVGQHDVEVQSLAAVKGIQCKLLCMTDAYANTDAALLSRVLRNPTQSAIKFTDHGSITLKATLMTDHVQLAVRDTGRGIAPDQNEKVFQEFYQAGNAERDRAQGVGLGLSIVRLLTDMLGTCTCTCTCSQHLGKAHNSYCNCRWQMRRKPRQPAVPKKVLTNAYNLCVLVIDDEKNVRTSLCMLLEELGCTCLQANGTAQAAQQVSAVRPDLVLADFASAALPAGCWLWPQCSSCGQMCRPCWSVVTLPQPTAASKICRNKITAQAVAA